MRELVLIILMLTLGFYTGFVLKSPEGSVANDFVRVAIWVAGGGAAGIFLALAFGWWYFRRLLHRSSDGSVGVAATVEAVHTTAFNFVKNQGATLREDSDRATKRAAATYAHFLAGRFLLAAATTVFVAVTGVFGSLMLLRQVELLSEQYGQMKTQTGKMEEQTKVLTKQTDLLKDQLLAAQKQVEITEKEHIVRRRTEVRDIDDAIKRIKKNLPPWVLARLVIDKDDCHQWWLPQRPGSERSQGFWTPEAATEVDLLEKLILSSIHLTSPATEDGRRHMGALLDTLLRSGITLDLFGSTDMHTNRDTGFPFNSADMRATKYYNRVIAGVWGDGIDLTAGRVLKSCVIGGMLNGLIAPKVKFADSAFLGVVLNGAQLAGADFSKTTFAGIPELYRKGDWDLQERAPGKPSSVDELLQKGDMEVPPYLASGDRKAVALRVGLRWKDGHHPLAYLRAAFELLPGLAESPLDIVDALDKKLTELGFNNDYRSIVAILNSKARPECGVGAGTPAKEGQGLVNADACPDWRLHLAVSAITKMLVMKVDPDPSRGIQVSGSPGVRVSGDLRLTKWVESVLVGVSFDLADLRHASFRDALLLGRLSFKGAKLGGADLRVAFPKELRGLERADFEEADLEAAAVDGIDFGDNAMSEDSLRKACVCRHGAFPRLRGKEIDVQPCQGLPLSSGEKRPKTADEYPDGFNNHCLGAQRQIIWRQVAPVIAPVKTADGPK